MLRACYYNSFSGGQSTREEYCKMPSAEPRTWAEELNSYRQTYGSRSYSSANEGQPLQRFVRTVPGVCPLAEIRHPLYAIGSLEHTINSSDGSLQRSRWHGWGDVSLLKQAAHTAATAQVQQPLPASAASKDIRGGLFGLLQGREAGGSDGWLGNIQIDPSKGKRSVTAPGDHKRAVSMTQLLAHSAPGRPADDGWVGNIGIDPAKGKGHPPDPSMLRGRADLFDVLQQRVLQQPAGDRCSQQERAEGKKKVEDSEAAQDHLFAATFKAGPATNGCWCDMPPVGKRPLAPPSNAAGYVNAAQTLRMEDPLPPGSVLGSGKPQGKCMVPDPYHCRANTNHVDMYSLMTFKSLSEQEEHRYQHAWNDATVQTKKKLIPNSAAATDSLSKQQIDFKPNRQMRYVPFGGLAQEKGMTMNNIVLNHSQGNCRHGGSSSHGSQTMSAHVGNGAVRESRSGRLAGNTPGGAIVSR